MLPAKPSRAIRDGEDPQGMRAGEALPPPPAPEGGEPPLHPSPRGLRGLDWFVFFVADVQTGFGPFVSVYLTGQRWTQFDIGLVQSAAGIVSLLGQMPGGAIVDAARSERFVAGVAIVTICVAALTYAALPIFPVVLMGSILHALASCVLGPAMAAISLGLVGHAAIGARFGRNARFASIGNGLAAAVMGACGYLLSARAVFIVTVLLLVPALLALRTIVPKEIDPEYAHGAVPRRRTDKPRTKVTELLRNRPQLGGALLSPSVGTRAQLWGRRPLLLIGFAALPIRGLLFASVSNPWLLVVVQLLDGVTASVFAVMVPLVIADLTRGTGHFNLGQGIVGTATGVGASLSATFAGYMTDRFGFGSAFAGLAAIALVGLTVLWSLMPETRPEEES